MTPIDTVSDPALLFGYRDGNGCISHKFENKKMAMEYWQSKNHQGSACRLTHGRWRTINEVEIWKETQKKIAQHMLGRLIKLDYVDDGTDNVVEGSRIFGSYWWPIVRDAVLERDGKCRLCGNERSSDLHVHHILPRHCGGSDHPQNLVTLCIPCHKMIHRNKCNEDLNYHKNQTRLEVEE